MIIAGPVGDDEGHTVGEVVSHVVQVGAVSRHGLGLAFLGEGGGEAGEWCGVVKIATVPTFGGVSPSDALSTTEEASSPVEGDEERGQRADAAANVLM